MFRRCLCTRSVCDGVVFVLCWCCVCVGVCTSSCLYGVLVLCRWCSSFVCVGVCVLV